MQWIDKFLLQSTENYIQYPMLNHNEKIYIWDFPDIQGVRTPDFHFRGCKFKSWSGN